MVTRTKCVTRTFQHPFSLKGAGHFSWEATRAMKADFDRSNFSVVVKNRARMPKPWRWEIYRAGRVGPISHSVIFFESRSTANLEGKAALDDMLKKLRF